MEKENQKINNYLNEICSKIKNKEVHYEIRKEIKSHITELIFYYQKQGYSEEAAINLALKDIGDTKKLGNNLNKVYKQTFDFKLFITIVLLAIIGLIGSFSFNSIFNLDTNLSITSNPYFMKNSLWLIIGIISFIFGYFIKLKVLKKLSLIFYILGFILYIIYLFNPYTGNALYYGFVLGPISISLFPLLQFLFLFGLSGIYSKLAFKNKKHIILAFILGLAPLICMSYSFNFIPMFIYYSLTFLIIIYFYSKNLKLLVISCILEIIIFYITSLPKIINYNFGSPNLVHQILTTSKFLGRSSTHLIYINLSYSLISAIGYFGFIFGFFIILILAYFMFRLIKLSLSVNNIYAKSLAFTIAIFLIVETIWGILMNLAIIPFAEVSIPFITYSGSLYLLELFMLGIFLKIYKLKSSKIIC